LGNKEKCEVKRILGMALTALVAWSGQAGLNVTWSSGGFTARDDGSPLCPGTGAQAAFVQMLFSPDSVRGQAQLNGSSQDDFMIAELPVTVNDDASTLGYALFTFTLNNQAFALPGGNTSGFMWLRLLDQGNQAGTFIPNSFYLDSALFTVGTGASFDVDLGNPGPPNAFNDEMVIPYGGTHPLDLDGDATPDVDSYRISDGSTANGPSGGIQEHNTVVPEPGTLACLGAGALLALLRRSRRT
jgi:hypothetical protein